MITDKSTIKCEATFSDDRKHRVLWKRVWDKDKPLACVIMINPCQADTMIADTTTNLVVNNIARLGEYGGVSIVNLFSLLTTKLNFRSFEQFNDLTNDTYIKKAAEESSVVILAWGKSADVNIKIAHRAEQVIKLLEGEKEKLRVISDGERMGMHPLTPALRSRWALVGVDKWLAECTENARKREKRAQEKLVTSKMESAEADPTDAELAE